MIQPTHQKTNLKILFAGIDGSGKSTCVDLLISKLDSDYTILKLSKLGPHLCANGEKQLAVKHNLYWLKESIRPISTKYRFFGLYLIMNFIYKCIMSTYVALFTNNAEIVIYETDTLLHPAVYITFHLPPSRFISRKMRLRIFSMLFGSRRDFLIFYLHTDAHIAVERIQKRGDNIHAHENVKDLTTLKEEFDKMVNVACESGLNVLEINTGNKSAEDVTNEIEMIVRRELGNPPRTIAYRIHKPEVAERSGKGNERAQQ